MNLVGDYWRELFVWRKEPRMTSKEFGTTKKWMKCKNEMRKNNDCQKHPIIIKMIVFIMGNWLIDFQKWKTLLNIIFTLITDSFVFHKSWFSISKQEVFASDDILRLSCLAGHLVYMGRDKYENEDLIAYGWPEDVWYAI